MSSGETIRIFTEFSAAWSHAFLARSRWISSIRRSECPARVWKVAGLAQLRRLRARFFHDQPVLLGGDARQHLDSQEIELRAAQRVVGERDLRLAAGARFSPLAFLLFDFLREDVAILVFAVARRLDFLRLLSNSTSSSPRLIRVPAFARRTTMRCPAARRGAETGRLRTARPCRATAAPGSAIARTPLQKGPGRPIRRRGGNATVVRVGKFVPRSKAGSASDETESTFGWESIIARDDNPAGLTTTFPGHRERAARQHGVPAWADAFQPGATDDARRAEAAAVGQPGAAALGASYADIRINRSAAAKSIATREREVQNVSRSASYGLGLRAGYMRQVCRHQSCRSRLGRRPRTRRFAIARAERGCAR